MERGGSGRKWFRVLQPGRGSCGSIGRQRSLEGRGLWGRWRRRRRWRLRGPPGWVSSSGGGPGREARARGEGVSAAREGQLLGCGWGGREDAGGPVWNPERPLPCFRPLGSCLLSGDRSFPCHCLKPLGWFHPMRGDSGTCCRSRDPPASSRGLGPRGLGTSALGTGRVVSGDGALVSDAVRAALPAGPEPKSPCFVLLQRRSCCTAASSGNIQNE